MAAWRKWAQNIIPKQKKKRKKKRKQAKKVNLQLSTVQCYHQRHDLKVKTIKQKMWNNQMPNLCSKYMSSTANPRVPLIYSEISEGKQMKE